MLRQPTSSARLCRSVFRLRASARQSPVLHPIRPSRFLHLTNWPSWNEACTLCGRHWFLGDISTDGLTAMPLSVVRVLI